MGRRWSIAWRPRLLGLCLLCGLYGGCAQLELQALREEMQLRDAQYAQRVAELHARLVEAERRAAYSDERLLETHRLLRQIRDQFERLAHPGVPRTQPLPMPPLRGPVLRAEPASDGIGLAPYPTQPPPRLPPLKSPGAPRQEVWRP